MSLIWKHDEKTNRAICLFSTTEKGQKYNKETILKELGEKKYPGITLSKDSAIIDDYLSFTAKHQPEEYKSVSVPTLNIGKLKRTSTVPTTPTRKSPGLLVVRESKQRSHREQQGDSDRAIHQESNPFYALFAPDNASDSTASPPIPTRKSPYPRSNSSTVLPSTPDTSSHSGRKGRSSRFDFQYKTTSTVPVTKQLTTEGEDSSYPSYASILLEHLIIESDDTALYRDTLGCKQQFTQRTAKDRLERTAIHLRTIDSFIREYQYDQNDKLYPVKGKIITLLEGLFEKELNPAYQEWKKQQRKHLNSMVLKELYNYFREAVARAMLNGRYCNNKPTEYELLSPNEQERSFGNMAQFFFANNLVRGGRVTMMLHDLVFLSDATYPDDLISTQSLTEPSINMLLSFKKYLIKDVERVARINGVYAEVRPLLIQSGEIECGSTLGCRTLMDQLIDNKDQPVGIYSSLIGTVRSYIIAANDTQKKPSGTKECHHWVDKVIIQLVHSFVVDPGFYSNVPHVDEQQEIKTVQTGDKEAEKIPDAGDKKITIIPRIEKLKMIDKDIYLCNEWIGPCKNYLVSIEWNRILRHLKDDSKKSADDIKAIATKLHDVIKMKGMDFALQLQSRASSSHITSSDNTGHSVDGIRMNFY